jgi:heme-degrading monooxygenase HmoA
MYTRLLTFSGATDIDGGVSYLRDEVLSVLHTQHGYRGVSVSADRAGSVFSILSLWDTEADRSASNSALGKARDEALDVIGGEMSIEIFDQVAQAINQPPVPGCPLLVTRVSMDPASVDANITFFREQVLAEIQSQPGFCALRNMIDRPSGKGIVGTVWENTEALNTYSADLDARRAPGIARGITFDETSIREILLSEII